MRRLIAVTAAATLLLASLGVGGAFAAGTPNSHSGHHNFGHGHVFRVHVSPVVWAGGRIAFTATFARCTVSTAKVTVTTDLTTGVTMKRAGTVKSGHSRACVWRGVGTVSSSATLGSHAVTFFFGDSTAGTTVSTRVIDHSTGTEASGGTH